MLLLAVVLGAALAALAPGGAGAQDDRSFSLPSLDVVAVVKPDASMDVTEVVTYDFDGGPFNFGIKTFERDLAKIRSFTAADEAGPLEVIPPDASVSGQWEWRLRGPTTDERVTFTLTYRVVDAVEVGADVGDLNWAFLGRDHPGIGRVSITVQVPPGIPPARDGVADTDASVLRGWGHGPRDGVVVVDESVVQATVDGLAERQFVEIRAAIPATAFAVTGERALLANVLEEERELAGELADQDRKRRLGFVLTPIITGIGALGTGLLWFTGGRERKPKEVLGEYWREPLDEKPAVALANLERGTIKPGPTIAGTLVDLAQRGYLRIVGEKQERLGPDKLVHRYHWLGKPYGPDVSPYERELMEMVFRGQTQTTSEEVDDWARANQTKAKARLDLVTKGVKREYDAHHFEEKPTGAKWTLLAVASLGVAGLSWLVKAWTDNGFAWVGVVAGVVLFLAGSRLLSNRTQAGAEAAAKAEGLKRFLKDFSRLEDAPIGHLILWERYLVYSVVLGVSADLVRGMAARIPQVANDPSFGVWYSGPGGRFDGFDRMEVNGASLATASTPKNTSGGGGGFSGGSSGGGGGGGFGAR